MPFVTRRRLRSPRKNRAERKKPAPRPSPSSPGGAAEPDTPSIFPASYIPAILAISGVNGSRASSTNSASSSSRRLRWRFGGCGQAEEYAALAAKYGQDFGRRYNAACPTDGKKPTRSAPRSSGFSFDILHYEVDEDLSAIHAAAKLGLDPDQSSRPSCSWAKE